MTKSNLIQGTVGMGGGEWAFAPTGQRISNVAHLAQGESHGFE